MLGRSCCDPVTTLTGRGTQQQVVSAHLDTYYGSGSVGSDLRDPMRTATGKARNSLVTAWLEQANTGMVGHDAREPVSTIIAGGKSGWGGATQRLVEARLELDGGPVGRRAQVLEFLWEHFGMPTPEEWADPTGTLDARRKFGLVILDNLVWMIVDIGLRMLTVGEMMAASGLPSWMDLSRDYHGRPVSKTHQTQMIGNMVHPDPCCALIATQCPDMILPGWTPGVGFTDSERGVA
jgi:DNA (cytosine-5)-methyltransferase 1